MSTAKPDRETLRRVKILAGLPDVDCDALLMCLRWRRLKEGDVLFRQGDPGDTMAIVSEGRLSVRLRQGAAPEVELNQVGVGEVLGEMSCIDPAARSATVVAVAPSMVAELSRDGLQTLREFAPNVFAALVGAVIQDVTRRLRDVDARIEVELHPAPRGVTAGPPTAPSQPSPAPPSKPPVERTGLRRFLDRLRGEG